MYLQDTLDRETLASYTLTITASDSHPSTPNTATENIAVTVGDYNDNTPTCPPNAYVVTTAEDTALTTVVLTTVVGGTWTSAFSTKYNRLKESSMA